MSFEAQQSRVDALVRLIAFVVLVFGAALIYFTYLNANVAGIAAEIVTMNYALGILLSAVGLIGTFAKFR